MSAKKPVAKKTTSAKPAKKSGQHVGRKSRLDGCTFKKLTKENPRREGSRGHKSWAKLKTGMTYEQFLKAGGSRSCLAMDIKRGHVKAMKKA